MNKEMIISSNGHETRVAILEDDLVAEIFVERERNRGVVGTMGVATGVGALVVGYDPLGQVVEIR